MNTLPIDSRYILETKLGPIAMIASGTLKEAFSL